MSDFELQSGEWSFRLAKETDAEAFSKWVAENPYVDPQDIQDGLHKNNPTSLTFVVCKNGEPVVFAPMYAVMHLAHLGFNPDSDADTRKAGLEKIMEWVSALAYMLGVRKITTLTKERYPIARWAKQHGFDVDPRQLFKLDLRKWAEGK